MSITTDDNYYNSKVCTNCILGKCKQCNFSDCECIRENHTIDKTKSENN